MSTSSRFLHPLWTAAVVISILYLAALYFEDLNLHTHYSTWIFSGVIMAVSIWSGHKTSSILLVVTGFSVGLLAVHYELAMHHHTLLSRQTLMVHVIGLAVFLFFSLPVALLYRKRAQTWHRWILARAADIGCSGDEGYSENARIVRSDTYSLYELQRFAAFMGKSRIAVPQWEDQTLVLLLPGEDSMYQDAPELRDSFSHVRFSPSGEIAAHVSHEDFTPYEQLCSFSALCKGLGNTLFDVLQQHREGEHDLVLREVHDDTVQAQVILFIIGSLVFLFAIALYFNLL